MAHLVTDNVLTSVAGGSRLAFTAVRRPDADTCGTVLTLVVTTRINGCLTVPSVHVGVAATVGVRTGSQTLAVSAAVIGRAIFGY